MAQSKIRAGVTENPLAGGSLLNWLGLDGFGQARDAFCAYADAQAGYRKNSYSLSEQAIAEIREHWADQVQRWNYQPPSDLIADKP